MDGSLHSVITTLDLVDRRLGLVDRIFALADSMVGLLDLVDITDELNVQWIERRMRGALMKLPIGAVLP